MNRCKSFFTIPIALLGIVLSLCVFALPAYAVADTPVEELFELDGNAIDESAIGNPDDGMPPDDWGQGDDSGSSDYVAGPIVNETTPGGLAHLSSFINDPNGDLSKDDIFTGGGSKDDLPIKAGFGSNGWAWTFGSAPDKDDLLGVGAAAYIPVIGELLIYDFGSLYAANGTSSIGNWFFKKDIGPCEDGTFGIVDSNVEGRPCLEVQPEGPLHSIGDTLVISENTNGGTVTNISVYKWVAGEYDECKGKDENWSFVPPKNNLCLIGKYASATCDGDVNTNPFACGVMNQQPSESPDSYLYRSKFEPDDDEHFPDGTDGIDELDYPAYTFLESGINISKILEGTECFSSFMKNTRTSAKARSQLKDFASGAFELCGIGVTKECSALLNTAGDQVDVLFWGEVENTGVVDLEILLADSEAGSEITAVCYDVNAPTGKCDPGDGIPPDLLFDSITGGAAFTLDSGRTVLYEGKYAFTGQLVSLDFKDTIMAIAKLGDTEVDTAEKSATCTTPVDPDIAVNKRCIASIDNGDTFRAEITGDVTNTGNVKLVNVTLEDNVLGSGEFTVVYDSNGNGLVDSGEPSFVNGNGLVKAGKLAFKATVISTSQTSHANTMTVYGTNFFDAADTQDANAKAFCEINPVPSIKITKQCDESINGTGVKLVPLNGVVSVEVGNIIEVTNDGTDEVLNPVTVRDSEMALSTSEAGWDCTSDPGVCVGSLGIGESIKFTQTYYPDGDNIIGALLNPGSVFFQNTAKASGLGVLSKEPAGPLEATAECKICPPCPTCN